MKIILASGSPRRKQLLEEAGLSFEIFHPNIDEVFDQNMKPELVAQFLSNLKNRESRKYFKNDLIITADTVVIKDHKILGKPNSLAEAAQMLSTLSNSSHQVVTGVTISNEDRQYAFSVTTTVFFGPLTQYTIDHYVSKYQPLDKAGAYGIQEWIGLVGISEIKGSYHNVVGLPVYDVLKALKSEFGMH
ncbi:MAG: septum formation protein Maf [Cyclobacteriaceae bacterium]